MGEVLILVRGVVWTKLEAVLGESGVGIGQVAGRF